MREQLNVISTKELDFRECTFIFILVLANAANIAHSTGLLVCSGSRVHSMYIGLFGVYIRSISVSSIYLNVMSSIGRENVAQFLICSTVFF